MTVSNMYIIIYILIFSLCASSLKVFAVKDTHMTSSERFLTKFNLNKNLLAETGRVAMKSLRKPLKMNRIFPQRSDKLDSVSPFELDTLLKILLTLRNLNHMALYKRINHVHNKLISWIEGSSKDRSPFPGHLAQHSFHQKVTSGSNSIRMNASKRFTFVGNSTQDSEEFLAGGNSTQASEGTSASINSTQKPSAEVAKSGNNSIQQAASVDTRNRTRSLQMTGKVSNEIECFVIQPYITFHLYVFIRLTPILLYRGDSCIGDFTYYVNFHSQRHLAVAYVRNISRQLSNSQLQQKICKMSSIVTIKFIHLQMACREQYSA